MTNELQGDEILQELAGDRETKRAKRRNTEMYMLMNLNEHIDHVTEEQKQNFLDFVVEMFDRRGILEYFEDKMSPDNPLANVDSVRVERRAEVGPQSRRLHLHAFVGIEHHGFLSFQANEFREAARQQFGHSVYLNCPLSSSARSRYLAYMQKLG